MNSLAGAHALGHPFGIMVHFAAMALSGIYDDFPNVRFAFLEAGAAWLPFVLERLEGSDKGFVPIDPEGDLVRLRTGESIRDRLLAHLRGGRIFVGVEGGEAELAHCVQTIGPEPFVFSSDFPHEVNLEICRHEIEEICENEALSAADKDAILRQREPALAVGVSATRTDKIWPLTRAWFARRTGSLRRLPPAAGGTLE